STDAGKKTTGLSSPARHLLCNLLRCHLSWHSMNRRFDMRRDDQNRDRWDPEARRAAQWDVYADSRYNSRTGNEGRDDWDERGQRTQSRHDDRGQGRGEGYGYVRPNPYGPQYE